MHDWGYAPTLEALAANLLGGDVRLADLARAFGLSPVARTADGVAWLRGAEGLVPSSVHRTSRNGSLNGAARTVAEAYARELVRHCPFVECAALSGSAASGGYADGDDIDFDLFVARGTKYTTYLVANLIGLRVAWRHRRRAVRREHRMPLLPKVVCINVVWPADATRPFLRQDAGLAFELARCIPLVGAKRFRQAIEDNPWIADHFPQLLDRRWTDAVPRDSPSPVGALLQAVVTRPRVIRLVERVSRAVSCALYRFVQSSRRADPIARERMEFLRRVKFPYEVFQD
jgi:hypothetical protein